MGSFGFPKIIKSKVKKSKYGAQRSGGVPERQDDGSVKMAGSFPSKLESSVYGILAQRESQGEIQNIKRQQSVILQDGPREVKIDWKLDFSYERTSDGKLCYVEAKGFETDVFRLKLKLWRKNPPAPLEIYKGRWDRPVLTETIDG